MSEPDFHAIAGQHGHWDSVLSDNPDMYGFDPSESAVAASAGFGEVGAVTLLELGAGQGRDTFHFIHQGFDLTALDFSHTGLASIESRAEEMGAVVRCQRHDVRSPLAFPDESFDACYSHMLFCMALTTDELVSLIAEVRRVLKPGGLVAYTARNTTDAHYRDGIDRGGDMWEHGGFIVHFFSPTLIERLSDGFEIIDRFEFTEGGLPRRLTSVTMRKV